MPDRQRSILMAAAAAKRWKENFRERSIEREYFTRRTIGLSINIRGKKFGQKRSTHGNREKSVEKYAL
jgi:hypothetical protein